VSHFCETLVKQKIVIFAKHHVMHLFSGKLMGVSAWKYFNFVEEHYSHGHPILKNFSGRRSHVKNDVKLVKVSTLDGLSRNFPMLHMRLLCVNNNILRTY